MQGPAHAPTYADALPLAVEPDGEPKRHQGGPDLIALPSETFVSVRKPILVRIVSGWAASQQHKSNERVRRYRHVFTVE